MQAKLRVQLIAQDQLIAFNLGEVFSVAPSASTSLMALLHFPSVGKCSVEIAKANSFIIIFNTSPKEGEPDPKWTKTGDQPAEEEVGPPPAGQV